MPECIVCKEYYEAGQRCKRCGSDNSAWERWRATRYEERGVPDGLLAFYAPSFYLPFCITVLALAFGLMGMARFWEGITLAAQLLAMAVTVCSCLVTARAAYGARHKMREQNLLQRVRRESRAVLGDIQLRVIAVSGFALLLVVVVAYTMTTSGIPGKLARWFFIDQSYLDRVGWEESISDTTTGGEQPGEDEADDLRKNIRLVLPFIITAFYVIFMISTTYEASLQSALSYAQKMNNALPQPIFLREDLLVEVVQREAGRIVYRTITRRVIGGEETPNRTEQESRCWIWDEMERTADGGIRLKAIARAGNKTEERPIGEWTERPVHITYVVEADPWSRITKVGCMKEPEGKK